MICQIYFVYALGTEQYDGSLNILVYMSNNVAKLHE